MKEIYSVTVLYFIHALGRRKFEHLINKKKFPSKSILFSYSQQQLECFKNISFQYHAIWVYWYRSSFDQNVKSTISPSFVTAEIPQSSRHLHKQYKMAAQQQSCQISKYRFENYTLKINVSSYVLHQDRNRAK